MEKLRGEELAYKLTSKGIWVDDPNSGYKGLITAADVCAGLSIGNIEQLEYLTIDSLICPPASADQIFTMRALAVQDMKLKESERKGYAFHQEKAYQYFIEKFIAGTSFANYFYLHAAEMAYDHRWQLRKGKPVLRTLCNLIICENVFPSLRKCMACKGRGRLLNQKICRSCSGKRGDHDGGKVEYIGSGVRELSERAIGSLCGIEQQSYAQTWKPRKAQLQLEYEGLIVSGLSKLADSLYREHVPKKEDPPKTAKIVTTKRRPVPVVRAPDVSRTRVNHSAAGRKTMSLKG